MSSPDDSSGPILHVIVVGFHHKRGCQVEYSFPPLIEGNPVDSHELPDEWKYLPPLALPDGAHNTVKDTIFFHLPSRQNTKSTVFGISCYRQIDAHELLSREADITRNTVQKSVCVLSTIPLYGLIQAKLELITHAYFKERDFSKVSLLEETFTNLDASLSPRLVSGSQVFLGLSGRDVIQHFKHKILVLFKLILLERRVLFFTSPVEPICRTMLTVLSLFPGMIERGLSESANYDPDAASSALHVSSSADSVDFLEVQYEDGSPNTAASVSPATPRSERHTDSSAQPVSSPSDMSTDGDTPSSSNPTAGSDPPVVTSLQRSFSLNADDLTTDPQMEDLLEAEDCFNWDEDKLLLEIDDALLPDGNRTPDPATDSNRNPAVTTLHKAAHTTSKDSVGSSSSTGSSGGTKSKTRKKHRNKHRVRPLPYDHRIDQSAATSTISTDEQGWPVSVFTKGNLCHPYLCLQYYDLLSDVSIRGFVIGATNHLFKQKKHLVDVVVEIADTKLDINDPDLRKQLTLTTADLRFADFLVKNVSDDRGDIFLDDTEWEGGDEWIRGQFRIYLLSLMATVNGNDEKLIEDYNSHFISAWKMTHNYNVWKASPKSSSKTITDVEPGHPFHGQLSMSDMKLKFSHSMQSTEQGKKLNAAVQQTGKVVANTTRVMGGALSSAKSAVSSWFTSLSGGPAQSSPDTVLHANTDTNSTTMTTDAATLP